ncbi:putative mitochondrial ribosomal protein subunit l37 [Echria macrotheca]|uniref:Large ribosomal subunit protein mL54 n=1 Tax=Echria macrotheca TaxID=438768 RepID=A0AAJ0BFQ4_9PEZI|nr:putative mitochondrial ribosomal protein subunit l37 [Echria macrotheca]
MICRTCLRRAAPQRLLFQNAPPRTATFTTSIVLRNAAAAPPAGDAAAAPKITPVIDASAPPAEPKAALSTCEPGTVLKGLNYFKNKTDPVALPDEAYPAWLWECLEVKKKTEAVDANAGDEFSKSRKQRRLAAKRKMQQEAKLLASGNLEALVPKVPLPKQSINLPDGSDGGVEGAIFAADKREELRKALRKERKAKIKESNYLKTM